MSILNININKNKGVIVWVAISHIYKCISSRFDARSNDQSTPNHLTLIKDKTSSRDL